MPQPIVNYAELESRIQQLTEVQPHIYKSEGTAGYERVEQQIVALENEVVSRFPNSRLGQDITVDRMIEQGQTVQQPQREQLAKETQQVEQEFGVSL